MSSSPYGLELFKGTAEFYDYRPSYPEALYDAVVDEFALDGQGDLLDLGCGPGIMADQLAAHFERLTLWDPDEEMLDQARLRLGNHGITHAQFEANGSRELPILNQSFRLVTMGQSFHWMDTPTVARQLRPLLETNGGLAIVSSDSSVYENSAGSTYAKVMKEVIQEFLGDKRLAGATTYQPPAPYVETLTAAGYRDIRERKYAVDVTRTAEDYVGLAFSLSYASRYQLGERADDFADKLQERLLDLEPSNQFNDTLGFSLLTTHPN